MKKVFAMLLTLTLALSLMAGCGASKTEEQPAESSDTQTEQPAQTETQLSGAVSTNGSTSMEKVIGALSEQFMADNPSVKITYDATGSGATSYSFASSAIRVSLPVSCCSILQTNSPV